MCIKDSSVHIAKSFLKIFHCPSYFLSSESVHLTRTLFELRTKPHILIHSYRKDLVFLVIDCSHYGAGSIEDHDPRLI